MVLKLFDRIIEKSCFPKVQNFEFELKKIGILRIFSGVIIFIRFYEIYHSVTIFGHNQILFQIISASYLFLIFIFTLGFFTHITTILILFSLSFFDYINGTGTLGTGISQILILPLALINPGHYYSFDKYLIKKSSKYAKLLKATSNFLGAKNSNEITRAYFISFIIYASISFAALLYHFNDYSWMKGLSLKMILLNSYLSKYYFFFRTVEINLPFLLSSISLIAFVFQTVFQLMMIPLIFNKYGKFFIFYWGLNFFICCLFLINLSYLPHIEIILWMLIFIPVGVNKEKINIFYDDFCNLCKNTIKFFKLVNFNGTLEFLPISTNKTKLLDQNLSKEEISRYMVGIYKSKSIIGYDLYTLVSKKNPLLYFIFPILILGKVTKIGPFIYDFISRNRLQYFGRCDVSFHSQINSNNSSLFLPKNSFIVSSIYFIYLTALLFYWLFNPNINTDALTKENTKVPRKYIRRLGFDLPNVFNETDLSMGQKWMVLELQNKDKLELVPIIGYDGERLNYNKSDILHFTNHNSDWLYFGTTLRFRRSIIGMDVKSISMIMQKENLGWENLEKRIIFDYKSNQYSGDQTYRVQIFGDNSNYVKHWSSNKNIYNKNLLFEQSYNYSLDKGLSLSDENSSE